jgi:hypothetical protein
VINLVSFYQSGVFLCMSCKPLFLSCRCRLFMSCGQVIYLCHVDKLFIYVMWSNYLFYVICTAHNTHHASVHTHAHSTQTHHAHSTHTPHMHTQDTHTPLMHTAATRTHTCTHRTRMHTHAQHIRYTTACKQKKLRAKEDNLFKSSFSEL